MPSYAELYFAESEADIPTNIRFMKLPYSFKAKMIQWKLVMKHEQETTWGVIGERIQMPMTYTMYRQMPPSTRRGIFQKMEKKLMQKDITHVLLPKFMNTCPFEHIQQCQGHYIKPFFIMESIHFMIDKRLIQKGLRDLEVIILDGNTKDVDMLIDFIYPHINYLTVITNNPERFKEKVKNIFDDVGLNVQILSYNKSSISQGDIIIDTHYDDPSIIHYCKEDAIYIDLGNHIEKTVMLLEKQNKVCVVDQFFLRREKEVVNTAKAEVILTIQKLFHRDYQQTIKQLQEEKITISSIPTTMNDRILL